MSFAAALPLLAHLPPRGEALSAQRANLVRFVEEEAEAFAELPYLPWTEEFFVLDAPPVVVLPAKVAVGLHGVFLTRPLVTDARSKVLMYYPGVLMTDSLFSRFHARFHCPTALRVPALDFYRQDTRSAGRGRKECITLVGDPTAPGAVVNDGAYAATPEQAHQRGTSRLLHTLACALLACLSMRVSVAVCVVSELRADLGQSRCGSIRSAARCEERQAAREC